MLSSSYGYPFAPLQGSTLSFTAAVVIPGAVQSTAGLGLYLVQNTSGIVVLLGWGTSSGAASTAAASATLSLPILPYTTQVLTLDRNLWFTGSASASAQVYITAGFGI